MSEEWLALLRALRHLVARARGSCVYVRYRDVARLCARRGLPLPPPQRLHRLMRAFGVERDRAFIRGGKVTWVLRRGDELWGLLLRGEYGEILERVRRALEHLLGGEEVPEHILREVRERRRAMGLTAEAVRLAIREMRWSRPG